MNTKQPQRLYLKNHIYYIRVAIPRKLQDFAKRKEFKYSLNTSDYYDAVKRLRFQSVKVDLWIDEIRMLFDMIIKDKKVLLSDIELDQLLVYRLRVIDEFFEKNYRKLLNHSVSFDDIALFSKKNMDAVNKEIIKNMPDVPPDANEDLYTDTNNVEFMLLMLQKLLYNYFEWLKERPDTTLSIHRLADEVIKNHYKFTQFTDSSESKQPYPVLKTFHTLIDIENTMRQKAVALSNNETFSIDNPKIANLVDSMKTQKNIEAASKPMTKTRWQDVLNDMLRPHKYSKSVTQSTLEQKERCLDTIFELMDLEYVEQIQIKDIQNVNKLIYRVPKNWIKKYKKGTLLNVLLDENQTNGAMSPTTVGKYITIFQEFLRYCHVQQYLNSDLSPLLDKPYIDKHKSVYLPFEPEELKKIFNPRTYFKRIKNQDNSKFWIPLISLYSGARLNEICQLSVDDFRVEKGIDYFLINDDGETKSVKNNASYRRVPIHPVLKSLGLMDYVDYIRKLGKERIFYSLKYSEKNRYGCAVSKAFGYYLDKKLKIKDSKKVFHSFRHTARTRFIDCKVSDEYVNIICGWEGTGTGNKNYLHRDKVDILKLYKEISKLKYPELDECIKKLQ